MGKVAYLVFGAESSCTRFVTNCLIEAGCSGETWNDNHEQKIDFEEPTDDLVVWRRSYPHKWDNTDYPYIIKDPEKQLISKKIGSYIINNHGEYIIFEYIFGGVVGG